MLNSNVLQEEIKEKDEEALKNISKLEYFTEQENNNFTIVFHFENN